MQSSRTGSREPRVRVEPARDSSDGADAADLAEAYGLTLDPWQRDILECWLGRDGNDKFTARTCGLSVPRQNGKNGALEGRELYGLCVLGERILHTAHEVKTAEEAFARLTSYFENDEEYPDLADMVKRIRRTNGKEAIELTNGACVKFSARSRGASRGLTFDLIVLDEAQELMEEHMEAVVPTKSAAPLGNPQLIMTGTPPKAGVGAPWVRARKKACVEGSPRSCWHEWSVGEVGDVTDIDRAYATNPAMGTRILEEDVRDEMDTMSPEGFARERLGWWDDRASRDRLFDADDWDRMRTDSEPSMEASSVGCGIKFSADGAYCAGAFASSQSGGRVHVEVARYATLEHGMAWAVDWAAEHAGRCRGFAVDGRSAADAFRTQAADAGIPELAMPPFGPRDAVEANSLFVDSFAAGTLAHCGDATVRDTVARAVKRKIGNSGGFGFAGADGADVTPVDAMALALWALRNVKRDPTAKVRRMHWRG